MYKKKEEILLKFFLVFILILFFAEITSALGVRPGKIEFNFEPGFEKDIPYTVFAVNSDMELDLYVEGNLSEYVTLSKKTMVGGGGFTAILKLPEVIEKPGKHRIFISVKEKVDEELIGGTVGTSIIIRGVIDIHVPYPGKYLEITSFTSNNVNIGEPVNFELDIINKGKENVSFTPEINIMSEDKIVETLYFKNRFLKSQEAIQLKKVLNTTKYNPGIYTAVAVVDYGKIAKAESVFKVGHLFISIINYPKKIFIGGLKKFDIEIESGWNNNIDGAYAEVFIFDNLKTINFKTSSTNLISWEKKNITGFFDTSNFSEGFHDANITLFYYGKEVGKSSGELIEIEFIDKTNKFLIWFIFLGILLLLLIIIFLVKRYLSKNEKK